MVIFCRRNQAMRSVLKDQLVGLDPKFNYRGLNQTRIETFSDAVFAVSFTLVVLSTTVPETFDELRKAVHDILPSFVCIVLIVVIWYQHYVFFLRYGLQDIKTVTINTFLLFLVLIYVYPLKFLTRFLYTLFSDVALGLGGRDLAAFGGEMNQSNMRLLMIYYGLGAMLIFITMAWLYRHSYKRREELELDEYETYLTKVSIWQNLFMSILPFLSVVIVTFRIFGSNAPNHMIGGFIYMLYPVIMFTFGGRVSKQMKRKFGS